MSTVAVGSALAIDVADAFQVYRTAEGRVAALRGLSLAVEAGEVVAIYGPSGSGKSTLMRLLAGFETAAAGVVGVLGSDLGALSERERSRFRALRIGLIDQHYDRALPPDLPCRETVALQPQLAGEARGATLARADELLALVGLADRGHARPAELSGGEQQRVAVAAALAHGPGLLLADEPAGELDDVNAALVYDLLRDAARTTGATVVMVTHDEAASRVADRTVRLRDGRISEEDGGLVVDRAGWVRLPPELRVQAAIGRRAVARVAGGGVELSPIGAETAVAGPPPTPAAPPAAGLVGRLEQVDKTYGAGGRARRVFARFDAVFEPGLVTVLTGRSGSGKSTALRLLAGLERPDAGRAVLGDVDLGERDRGGLAALRREEIAVVGQNPGIVPYLTTRENVALGLAVRGAAEAAAQEHAETWLRQLGLGARLHLRAAGLSGGERQRVAIARALASAAPVLLLDEPTSRLDEQNAALVSRALRAAAAAGATVVCATHEPILMGHADRRLVLGTPPAAPSG